MEKEFVRYIGVVIISGYAMKNCISFLSTIRVKQMMWIARNGVKSHRITHINFERVQRFII